MDNMDGAISFFKKYIGEKTASTLTLKNWNAIFRWWKEASEENAKNGDASLGES